MTSGEHMPEAALISVVDDDRSFRESMDRLLRSLGYSVETFASGADFLSSAKIIDTGCLIVDVDMPAMTGLELYRRLVEAGRKIPTILVTGYPNDGDRDRALKDGVVAYLRKPFSEQQLTQCVRAAVESGKPQQGHH
jgi:FixJ family two-component response regulator